MNCLKVSIYLSLFIRIRFSATDTEDPTLCIFFFFKFSMTARTLLSRVSAGSWKTLLPTINHVRCPGLQTDFFSTVIQEIKREKKSGFRVMDY